MLSSESVLLLSTELNLLEILERRGELSQIRSQLAILLLKLINLFPE